MTTDELIDTLRTLCQILDGCQISGTLETSLRMAAEQVCDQLRYRATGSVLATKEPV